MGQGSHHMEPKAARRKRPPAHVVGPDARQEPKASLRDVFVYFIHGGKIRAPAAAQALAQALGTPVGETEHCSTRKSRAKPAAKTETSEITARGSVHGELARRLYGPSTIFFNAARPFSN